MHTRVHLMTSIYVTLADFFAHHPQLLKCHNSNNSAPAFTDAEVLTIALRQSYFQTPTLKRTYLLVPTTPKPSRVCHPINTGLLDCINSRLWWDNSCPPRRQ